MAFIHLKGMDSPLQPAFDWQARILQIRNAAAGDTVGYGGTYKLDRDSRIATLGVGYADGYRRQLGGMASVSIGGQPAPVIGRVSMDSITVDVTDFDQRAFAPGQPRLFTRITVSKKWRVMSAPFPMR